MNLEQTGSILWATQTPSKVLLGLSCCFLLQKHTHENVTLHQNTTSLSVSACSWSLHVWVSHSVMDCNRHVSPNFTKSDFADSKPWACTLSENRSPGLAAARTTQTTKAGQQFSVLQACKSTQNYSPISITCTASINNAFPSQDNSIMNISPPCFFFNITHSSILHAFLALTKHSTQRAI